MTTPGLERFFKIPEEAMRTGFLPEGKTIDQTPFVKVWFVNETRYNVIFEKHDHHLEEESSVLYGPFPNEGKAKLEMTQAVENIAARKSSDQEWRWIEKKRVLSGRNLEVHYNVNAQYVKENDIVYHDGQLALREVSLIHNSPSLTPS